MRDALIELARITPLHWVLVYLGIALAIILAFVRRRAARFQISAKDLFGLLFCCIVGGLIGSKSFQLIGFIIRDGTSPDFWTLENWSAMMSGLGVWYGGLIGGFSAAMGYMRLRKLSFREVTDLLVPSVLLGHAFGRFGCFFSGCCFGHAADWGLALHGGAPRIPVQLFEAGFNLLLMTVLLIVRPDRKRPGLLLPIYLMAYAVGRFILEFFRGDMGRGIVLGVSTSQWISLLIFPAGACLLWWMIKQYEEGGRFAPKKKKAKANRK